jgi:hypothetical protein
MGCFVNIRKRDDMERSIGFEGKTFSVKGKSIKKGKLFFKKYLIIFDFGIYDLDTIKNTEGEK